MEKVNGFPMEEVNGFRKSSRKQIMFITNKIMSEKFVTNISQVWSNRKLFFTEWIEWAEQANKEEKLYVDQILMTQEMKIDDWVK